MTEIQLLDDAIVNPRTYANPEAYHALFANLRETDPVHWTQPSGYRPFWTVTKHADIREVELAADKFLNDPRLLLLTESDEAMILAATGSQHVTRSLVSMDNPDHHAFRIMTQSWFAPKNIRGLEDKIRKLANEVLDRMVSKGGECDFVTDVAVWYPLRVIMEILGVPAEDEPMMLALTQQVFGPQDPDFVMDQAEAGAALLGAVKIFDEYFHALTLARREEPRDDVATLIANAQINGEPIGRLEAMSYYVLIATAGHDTTSTSAAEGLLALIQNPAEFAKLRADPTLLPSAIDEFIRWSTPVKHFFRTATEDYELRGRKIRAGDGLIMCYPSANRDADVYEDPYDFRVDRGPAKHLAFGVGAHLCLGQHLAKLELRVLFEELFKRLDSIELAGEPRWVASNFVSGLKHMPIRYSIA
ncbi:cytochrome P450 [soil metagenome]